MAGCFSKKKELNDINFEDFSNPWNFYSIFLCNETIDWIKWLMNKKLLKDEYFCVKCGNVACKLGLKRDSKDRYVWRCPSRNHKYGIRENSFFSKSHFP